MHHVVDAAHGLTQTVSVTHVTNKITHARRVERLLHFVLLQLVTGEHHHALGLVLLEQARDEFAPERTCAAGDENRFTVEHMLIPVRRA
ncbi:hypothetical protein D3C85_692510 [compost metagenome]